MILHVCQLEKFIPAYVEFVNKEFDSTEHFFLGFGEIQSFPVNACNFKYIPKSFLGLFVLLVYMLRAKKIVLHGLFNNNLSLVLSAFSWLPRKSIWFIWGGDLYDYLKPRTSLRSKVNEYLRGRVVASLGGVATYLQGDYDRAVEWYGAKGIWLKCNGYLSNVYHGGHKINMGSGAVLVGNSADPSNCHGEIFLKLENLVKADQKIICPLSYGDMDYADRIEAMGKQKFGERFIALRNFMALDEYNKLMEDVSVVIFAHKRQQAMGNTINLIGAGKKVIVRGGTAQSDLLQSLGIHFDSFENFNLIPLDFSNACSNQKIISSIFSRDQLIMQWRAIFLGEKVCPQVNN